MAKSLRRDDEIRSTGAILAVTLPAASGHAISVICFSGDILIVEDPMQSYPETVAGPIVDQAGLEAVFCKPRIGSDIVPKITKAVSKCSWNSCG